MENNITLWRVSKITKHNKNHSSQRIKHLFLISLKLILENHGSRLPWKSRFVRKKLAISHFSGEKRPTAGHKKYPLPHSGRDKSSYKIYLRTSLLFDSICWGIFLSCFVVLILETNMCIPNQILSESIEIKGYFYFKKFNF